MKQFSNNGNPLEIQNVSGKLIFIDPIYFNQIVHAFDTIKDAVMADPKEYILFLEQRFFPYGGGALIGFKDIGKLASVYKLDIKSIKLCADNEQLDEQGALKNITTFVIDSGSFLLFDFINFEKLTKLVKYEDLIYLANDARTIEYIRNLNDQLGNKGWSYIISPGLDLGYEFEGDGSYIIL